MEPDAFFREATLRICGNLEIEEALQSLIRLLRTFMPADHLFLQHYDPDLRSMRTIAYADEGECRSLDLLTRLSEDAGELAGNGPPEEDVFLFEDPMAFPITREMNAFHGVTPTSVMILTLRNRGIILGYLVLLSGEEERFREEHLERVRLLKEPLIIAMSNALKHREVLRYNALLADDNRFLHGELRRASGEDIVGARFGLRPVMHKVLQVAALNSPVLLLGETGTGKDLMARAVHDASSRSGGPFVSVNCGAIPETLVDSELFGHEKGAFTGAHSQKRGRFERAHQGTLFLDEIGELPPQAQVRLLRVLQHREIERVGGVETIPLDIRIVAATNRDLEEMVRSGTFREDLWFRLNVFPIWIPPLRDRAMDIPSLVQHFLERKAKELKLRAVPAPAPGALDPLMTYPWPGNVRELENVIERAMILDPAGPLRFEHLGAGTPLAPKDATGSGEETETLDALVSRHIQRVLARTGGKVNGPDGAAALLGVNPSTLRNRMKRLGIPFGRRQTNGGRS